MITLKITIRSSIDHINCLNKKFVSLLAIP
jgi:hypothetical protein